LPNTSQAPQGFGVRPENNPRTVDKTAAPAFGADPQLEFDFTENNDSPNNATVAGQHTPGVEASHFVYEINNNVSTNVKLTHLGSLIRIGISSCESSGTCTDCAGPNKGKKDMLV
jgi:hypothetical protein